MTEDPSQRPGDVICGYLGRGELVQHRLELVVVVAVQEDHVDIILGKMLGAGDAREAAPNDEHCRISHGPSPPLDPRQPVRARP